MSDLVERLWASDAASALTNEAARKIEALEAEVARLREALKDTVAAAGGIYSDNVPDSARFALGDLRGLTPPAPSPEPGP